MTIINLYTVDQALYTSTRPKLASGDKDSVFLNVKFDDAWAGYARSAVFYTSNNPTVYEAPMSNITASKLKCTIPHEVLTRAGNLFIGVRGLKNGTVKTSAFVRYKIEKGADGMMVFEPSPDVYQQLLTMFAETTGDVAAEAKARQAADGSVRAEMLAALAKEMAARIDRDSRETNERQAEIAVERAKIAQLREIVDALAADEDWESQIGYDEFAAEVQDARIDADGNEHADAGTAVRAQIIDVRRSTLKKNLIDFHKLTRGYLTTDGWLNNYNNGFNIAHEVTTDFIEIDTSRKYYFAHKFNAISAAIKETVQAEQGANGAWFCFGLYDASKTFIKRVQYDASQLIIDGSVFNGAVYVRISYRTYMFNHPVFVASSGACETLNEMVVSDNLLETYPMIFNGYVANTSGAVIGTTHDINGYIPTEQNELTSDFIPCAGGEEMFIFSTATRDNFIRVAFYAEDGHFISSLSYSPTATDNKGTIDYNNFIDIITVPEGAVALRVSCRGSYIVECVLAHNDDERRGLYAKCLRDYRSKYETEKIELSHVDCSNIKGVAHRGQSANAPENTLAAYRLARKEGFAYVECDVSFTSDGYAVLLHDDTVDRTSNGSGSIANMTLAAVKALDFGAWKSEEYAGERIPQFTEFIALCKNLGLHPYIELKTGTEAQIKGLFDVVKRYGMKDKVTWISFNSAYLGYIKAVDPFARLGFTVDSVSASTITTIKQTLRTGNNEVFVDCGASNANADAVQLCMADDIPLEVWTVNTEAAILALNPYVSGVTSDNLIAGKVFYNNQIGG